MKYFITIILVLLSLIGYAQEKDNLKVRGFVDTYHALRISEPNDFMASRSRFRGELQKVNGNSYFFASLNAVYNNAVPELSQIALREAFLEYTGNNWGFKAGRQIVIWGKADGMKITDVISPMDLTEFLAQDYDDIRMPVNAITFNKFNNNWDLELICVPIFEGYRLPGADNPWGADPSSFGEGIVFDRATTPDISIKNVEYGGKLSFYLSGIDFEISGLNTWNKMPVYSYSLDTASLFHIVPEHHRLGFAGLGVSKSLGSFVVRGEGAFYFNKKFSPTMEHFQSGLFQKQSINYLVGIDWYPGNEWSLTGQFSEEYIVNYTNKIDNPEHTLLSTIGISKKVFRSNLKLSTFAYIGLNNWDFFNRTSVDYALSDNIHVMGGFDWFYGDAGVFGRYQDNSEIFIKAKFNF